MHFNGWAFGYPYTFRGWREEDWQRYLDILSYQGIICFTWAVHRDHAGAAVRK